MVIRADPAQRGRAVMPTLATLPPGRPRATGDSAESERPGRRHRPSLPSSLRIQAATLFVLLAIIESSLLATIAFAYQAADQTQVEQDKLQDWRHASDLIDASAQSVITEVIPRNNAIVANDPGVSATQKANYR